MQTPESFVQLAQFDPHEIQVLFVLFKYFPVGQTDSGVHFLLVEL
jgi:hypothetical protein